VIRTRIPSSAKDDRRSSVPDMASSADSRAQDRRGRGVGTRVASRSRRTAPVTGIWYRLGCSAHGDLYDGVMTSTAGRAAVPAWCTERRRTDPTTDYPTVLDDNNRLGRRGRPTSSPPASPQCGDRECPGAPAPTASATRCDDVCARGTGISSGSLAELEQTGRRQRTSSKSAGGR
jgi:hypothetical protein